MYYYTNVARPIVLASSIIDHKATKYILLPFFFVLWVSKGLVIHGFKLVSYLALSLATVVMAGLLWILVNNYLIKNHEIMKDEATGIYTHSDPESSYFLDHGGGRDTPLAVRMKWRRSYIRSLYMEAGLDVPENLPEMRNDELYQAFTKLKSDTAPNLPSHSTDLFDLAFAQSEFQYRNVTEVAEESPLEGKYEEIWELARLGGASKIRNLEERGELASWLMVSSRGDAAFYFPFNDTIYVGYRSAYSDLKAEIPHAIQFREEPIRSYFRFLTGLSRSVWCANYSDAIVKSYRNEYDRIGSLEYEAHSIREPLIAASAGFGDELDESDKDPLPEHSRRARDNSRPPSSFCSVEN